MALFELAPPGAEPVSVAEARGWLRVGHEDEDALIASLIAAARERVEALTGLALITRSWRETLDDWPQRRLSACGQAVRTGAGPLISVEAVRIHDVYGEVSVWSPDEYRVEPGDPGRIIAVQPFALPRPGRRAGGIEIDFTAGFGAAWADIPPDLAQAVLLLAAEYHTARSGERPDMPGAVAGLIAAWQPVRVTAGGHR